jgi:hypothetical protein
VTGGIEPGITDDRARDLELLSNEFKSNTHSIAVADRWARRSLLDAEKRRITALLEAWLQSQDRALRLLDRLHQTTIEGERANVMKDIDLAESSVGPWGARCGQLRARLDVCGR